MDFISVLFSHILFIYRQKPEGRGFDTGLDELFLSL
jgi:hypothetical protein